MVRCLGVPETPVLFIEWTVAIVQFIQIYEPELKTMPIWGEITRVAGMGMHITRNSAKDWMYHVVANAQNTPHLTRRGKAMVEAAGRIISLL